MKFIYKIFPYITNKYIFTSTLFLVWVIFFDSSNLATQWKLYWGLKDIEKQKEFYNQEIAKNKLELNELISNNANLETYGREKYLMKKDDEDVYILVSKSVRNDQK